MEKALCFTSQVKVLPCHKKFQGYVVGMSRHEIFPSRDIPITWTRSKKVVCEVRSQFSFFANYFPLGKAKKKTNCATVTNLSKGSFKINQRNTEAESETKSLFLKLNVFFFVVKFSNTLCLLVLQHCLAFRKQFVIGWGKRRKENTWSTDLIHKIIKYTFFHGFLFCQYILIILIWFSFVKTYQIVIYMKMKENFM